MLYPCTYCIYEVFSQNIQEAFLLPHPPRCLQNEIKLQRMLDSTVPLAFFSNGWVISIFVHVYALSQDWFLTSPSSFLGMVCWKWFATAYFLGLRKSNWLKVTQLAELEVMFSRFLA